MPSNGSRTEAALTRRRLLAGLGTVATASFAGCAGRLPGTIPDRIATETTVERNEITWTYPPTDGDDEGIGYTSIRFDGFMRRTRLPPALQFRFNSTVGGIASSDPYDGYEVDWFRFRVGPPSGYNATNSYEIRVQARSWPAFSAHYERRGGRRVLVVSVPDVHSDGTIEFPSVLDPASDALPGRLYCSFTVRASRPGLLGKSVQVADSGTLELGGE